MATFTQLTLHQRYQIHALRQQHFSLRDIAAAAGIHCSTVSRELRRRLGGSPYTPDQAHEAARFLQRNAHRSGKVTGRTKLLVLVYLILEFSPEQVAGTLRKRHGLRVSFQSIYRFIQRDNFYGGQLFKYLLRVRKRQHYIFPKRRRPDHRQGPIRNRVSIKERPEVVAAKARQGDWEIDTIIGPRHQSALLTITERSTQFLYLRKLSGMTSGAVKRATIEALQLRNEIVHTITADNGSEFAQHEDISAKLRISFFFADPYSAWQRGSNENINGQVRRFFPKGTDFQTIEEAEVRKVQNTLNHRPRKSLDYQTPAEALFGEKPYWINWASVAVVG
ncbi:IS30 family transposase [Allohahella sp. A8]|uniref:IS30 family transposase n=1 Tax=Allohahella sp. A8 TaxID=3141461 RepID=UPI003A8005CF